MDIVLDNPCVVVIGEVVAGESARLRAELETLVNNSNRSKFDIAETAYRVKRTGDYGEFTTFKEYSKTLNIKPQTIRYLTRIAEVMDRVGIYRNQYEQIGIAKLREITSLEPGEVWRHPETNEETPITEFIVGLVQRGATLGIKEIQQYVRTLKGFTGENDLCYETLCMTRSVLENTWQPAMRLAKLNIGTVKKDDEGVSQEASDGAAAEALASCYLNDPNNGTFVQLAIEEDE